MKRLLPLCALLAGCLGDNALSGSAGELFPLEVSKVEILRNDEALQITYLVNRSTDVDVVARLGIALAGVELKAGSKLDLAGDYAPGHPRATVSHEPAGEAARLFPRVKKGALHLGEGGAVGQLTRGDFSVVFEAEGGDLGAGRTLIGTFRAEAKDAGF